MNVSPTVAAVATAIVNAERQQRTIIPSPLKVFRAQSYALERPIEGRRDSRNSWAARAAFPEPEDQAAGSVTRVRPRPAASGNDVGGGHGGEPGELPPDEAP
ncbi:hypothetical protein KRMM14A1259_48570 [Krasilnikovia sp. MM14-A1259]